MGQAWSKKAWAIRRAFNMMMASQKLTNCCVAATGSLLRRT
jgi:hypothetical protein